MIAATNRANGEYDDDGDNSDDDDQRLAVNESYTNDNRQ